MTFSKNIDHFISAGHSLLCCNGYKIFGCHIGDYSIVKILILAVCQLNQLSSDPGLTEGKKNYNPLKRENKPESQFLF
jgi:hypothetical protein